MKIETEKTQWFTDVYLINEEKYVAFSLKGTGDVYWWLKRTDGYSYEFDAHNKDEFIIDKENIEIYNLFDQLFSDIENVDIYDESFNEDKTKAEIRRYKDRFRKNGEGNYFDLYNKEEKTITWYSDETANEVCNYLKIKKKEDSFELDFHTQPYIPGYCRDFNTSTYIPIRFRNSGSKYNPFNAVFLRMYMNMVKVASKQKQLKMNLKK